MLLLNKIKTDLNLTRNEFIYGLVTTTRRLERLAAQVEVTYKFCAAPKEAARVAVINPPSVRNMKKMWVVKDTLYSFYVIYKRVRKIVNSFVQRFNDLSLLYYPDKSEHNKTSKKLYVRL
jgi:hypothetical protein